MTTARSTGLIVTGLVVALIAAIAAKAAKDAADKQAIVDEYTAAFNNQLIDFTPDYTGMWVLILIAALGVVVGVVGIAVRPKAEAPPTV